MKRKKGFTLIEISIAVIIIAILASFGVANYSMTIERAHQRICEDNLRVLHTALKIYAMDNDAIPASLSKLPKDYIMLAEERVRLNEKKDFIYYVSRLINWSHQRNQGKVWAQPFGPYYGDDINVITCPSDPTPPPDNISYGINPGLTINDLRLGTNVLAIADCDYGDLSRGLAHRHKKGLFRRDRANLITAGGRIVVVPPQWATAELNRIERALQRAITRLEAATCEYEIDDLREAIEDLNEEIAGVWEDIEENNED